MTQMDLFMKQKQTHRDQICGCQGEEGGGRSNWEFEVNRCKLLYIEWIKNKVLLYSIGNHTQYAVINQDMLAWMKHKLESRFLGEISITSDMLMTSPLWQKAKRN